MALFYPLGNRPSFLIMGESLGDSLRIKLKLSGRGIVFMFFWIFVKFTDPWRIFFPVWSGVIDPVLLFF